MFLKLFTVQNYNPYYEEIVKNKEKINFNLNSLWESII